MIRRSTKRERRAPFRPWGALLVRLLWPLCVCLSATTIALADTGQPAGDVPQQQARSADLVYVQRSAVCSANARAISAHLVLFSSRAFRLEVIDLGAVADSRTRSLAQAFRSGECVAGVNGGFFHPDGRPLGLMIASGRRVNRFESTALLSGVLYGDDRGIHLVRRARFQDHRGIDALLQSGPYLVEDGRMVRGLSSAASDRRTFVATDWRGHWALGVTRTPVTLAELAECLVAPGVLTPWASERALNLDGGSSSGFFFAGDSERAPVVLSPWKPVRNLLGIRPR